MMDEKRYYGRIVEGDKRIVFNGITGEHMHSTKSFMEHIAFAKSLDDDGWLHATLDMFPGYQRSRWESILNAFGTSRNRRDFASVKLPAQTSRGE